MHRFKDVECTRSTVRSGFQFQERVKPSQAEYSRAEAWSSEFDYAPYSGWIRTPSAPYNQSQSVYVVERKGKRVESGHVPELNFAFGVHCVVSGGMGRNGYARTF